jgi:hypothetical protein
MINNYMKLITSIFYQDIKFSLKKLHILSSNLSSRYMCFLELSIDLLAFIVYLHIVIYHNFDSTQLLQQNDCLIRDH